MEGSDGASSLAIVAIPSENDYVWKISSEKVPHLTLCFLGDQSSNPNIGKITDFVEHVADTSMHRFGLSVDHRGLLGDKDADVLFFEGHNIEYLERIRSYLLKDRNIAEAYASTEQYSTWTPHMTLGYPETPAKPDNRDYPGITWVNFDRIALWTGDYEGPTFRLNDDDGMAMSDQLEEFLEHFGVKGMKWGVRRNHSSESDSEDAKNAAEAAKKVRKHGTRSLTNKELQALVTRMNLEQQFTRLAPETKSKKAAKFAADILVSVGKEQARRLASDAATKQIAKFLATAR